MKFDVGSVVTLIHEDKVTEGKVQEITYTKTNAIETTRYKLDVGNGKQVFKTGDSVYTDKKELLKAL